MRYLIIIVSAITVFLILCFVLPEHQLSLRNNLQETINASGASLPKIDNKTEKITLMAVGDVMLDRGVALKINKVGQKDYKFPFLKIADYLNQTDLVFGNLESIISDKGSDQGGKYSFRADPRAADALRYAGFNILSVANNHIFNYGREAMEDSFRRIKAAGMDYVGGGFNKEEARSAVVKNIKGTKIAFLAYNVLGSKSWVAENNKSGIAWPDEETAREIKKAKEENDLVIVSFHFGEEYQTQPSELQKNLARVAVEAGADLILGHHPHVAQPVEQYKNGWIAYSLGNFVFDQNFSQKTMEGLLLEVVIKDKKINEVNQRRIIISKDYQPSLSEE